MSKPYWSGPGQGAGSRFADDPPTGRGSYALFDDSFDPPTEKLGLTDPYDHDTYGDGYGYGRPDHRWRWVAGLAAVVLLVALVAIALATRGGDSATSAAPPAPAAPSTPTPRTVIATAPPADPTAAAELPPETVVTVTTTAAADAHPPAVPPPVPAPEAAPPDQTITYTVTGTRQLFDLVSVIYTDEQGFPRTDVNVALPWSRTITLNPGVQTKSVTATSLTGQLNCSVTDAAGATLAAQIANAAIASCTP